MRNWGVLGILLTLVFLFYRNALNLEFLGDDHQISRSLDVFAQGFSEVLRMFPSRPVLMLTFWIDYQFWNLSPVACKIENLIFLALAGFCAYQMFSLLLKKHGRDFSWQFPLTFAALYTLHPLHNQAVNIMIQRGTILAGLFSFLTIYLFLKHLEENRRAYLLLSYLAFAVGVLCKGTVLGALLVLLCYLFVFRPKVSPLKLLPFVLFLVFQLLAYSEVAHSYYSRFDYFAAQTYAVFLYLKLMILPLDQHYLYDIPIYHDWKFAALLACHLLLVATGIYFSRKRPLVGFALLALYASFLPENSFITIQHLFFEHRAFQPLAYFAMFLMVTVNQWPKYSLKIALGLALILLPFYAIQIDKHNREVETLVKWIYNTLTYTDTDRDFNSSAMSEFLVTGKTQEGAELAAKLKAAHPEISDYGIFLDMYAFQKASTEPERIQALTEMGTQLRQVQQHGLADNTRELANRFVLERLPNFLTGRKLLFAIEKLLFPQVDVFRANVGVYQTVLNSYAMTLTSIVEDLSKSSNELKEDEAVILARSLVSLRVFFGKEDSHEAGSLAALLEKFPTNGALKEIKEWSKSDGAGSRE